MPTLIAYSAKLAPRTRSSLLHRYAMDYIRLNEHSAAKDSLKRGKEEAERSQEAMGLSGVRPIELLRTVQGAELVKEFLGRLEYGVYN